MKRLKTERKQGLPESRASNLCIVTNLFLALVKLLAGILCSAPTLISDAIHSTSDLASTAIVAIGIRLARKSPDGEHPYGHDRFECLASVLLSVILLLAGVGIGYGGISDILTGAYREVAAPLPAAILIALLSVMLKLLLARYMNAVSRRTHSSALRADAFHQISDALASLCALGGIVSSILGFRIFDPIASVFISLFLLRAALVVYKEAAEGLTDRSVGGDTEGALRLAAESVEGVTVRGLRTRRSGDGIYLELLLLPDPTRTVASYSVTVQRVRERIHEQEPRVRECTVIFFPP